MSALDDVKCLDHGYVRLIQSMGSDESIVEAARMSTNRGFVSWDPYFRCKACGTPWVENPPHPLVGETISLVPGFDAPIECCNNKPFPAGTENFPRGDEGVLESLWGMKHHTPFEMCEVVFEIQAPIMVFREWHRHRTQSYNEFSARYAQMPNLHYLPDAARIQKQSASNKQGSDGQMDQGFAMQVISEFGLQQEKIYETYDEWVELGLAKEVARLNTPVSRYSKMRAKTDLRNWLAFLNLRMRPGAQWEIRQFANAVSSMLKTLYPRTFSLFEEYDLYGAHFSRTELEALRLVLDDYDSRPGAISAGLSGRRLDGFLKKLAVGGTEILP